MSRIDPDSVVVLVRDSSDQIVRIGVSRWRELRETVRRVDADDETGFKGIETQVTKATSAGIAPS